MASDRRCSLNRWLQLASQTVTEQELLTAAIDQAQSEIWMEVADLDEGFAELARLERALCDFETALEERM